MTAELESTGEIIAILAESLVRLELLGAIGDDQSCDNKPEPRAWSLRELLAHLRACADVWSESIQAMLGQDEPVLEDEHPRKRMKRPDYWMRPFEDNLRLFLQGRHELLEALRGLPEESWRRGARIGRRRHTVFSQARRMALHDRSHWEQFENLAAHARASRASSDGR